MTLGQDVTWMLDIKYQDTGVVPEKLLRVANQVLGERVIFVSSQPAMLTECHRFSGRTAQFFRRNVSSRLTFEPDYYIQTSKDELHYPLPKTLVYCQSVGEAKTFLRHGVELVMVDGSLLM